MSTKKTIRTIDFIGGEKGGVGKSYFSRIFLQFLLDKNKDIALFDGDRTNTTFSRYYQNKKHPITNLFFSEGEDYKELGNVLMEAAFTRDVLIDLPGQSIHALNEWLEANCVFEIAAINDIKLCYWFVSDGSIDSFNDFKIVTDLLKGRVRYVFVKNLGKGTKWDFNLKKLESLFKIYKIEAVEIPAFKGTKLIAEIETKSMSWDTARDYKNYPNSIFDRHRVKVYLNSAYEDISSTTIISQRIESETPAEFELISKSNKDRIGSSTNDRK